jgi:hypothetical protein
VFTRIVDDFQLELRLSPPDQAHDDAVMQLLAWLRDIDIVDAGAASTLDEVLDALRAAATAGSPPLSTLSSPPAALRIHATDAASFFDAAFRAWTTELRPLWRTVAPDDDAVLLAEVELPVGPAPDGRWRVEDPSQIVVRDNHRPYLLPSRFVQELAIAAATSAGAEGRVEAAGIIKGDVNVATYRTPRKGGLRVAAVAAGEITVTFNGYVQPAAQGAFQYVVSITGHVRPAAATAPVLVTIAGYDPAGIRIRVADAGGAAIAVAQLATIELAIEITRYVS